MKAIIDIPDDLYRKVKAKSALEGKRIREVTIDLFEQWVHEDASRNSETPEEWLSRVRSLAEESVADRIAEAPSASDIFEGTVTAWSRSESSRCRCERLGFCH